MWQNGLHSALRNVKNIPQALNKLKHYLWPPSSSTLVGDMSQELKLIHEWKVLDVDWPNRHLGWGYGSCGTTTISPWWKRASRSPYSIFLLNVAGTLFSSKGILSTGHKPMEAITRIFGLFTRATMISQYTLERSSMKNIFWCPRAAKDALMQVGEQGSPMVTCI